MHEVVVSRSTDLLEGEPDDDEICGWVEFALNNLEHPAAEVSVRIVGVDEIVALNQQYRNKDSATNVLSFPAGVSVDDFEFLGDIVVCNQVVRDEAENFERTFGDRYAHILIHGLLHLLGHDHVNDNDRERMESLEINLMSMLGKRNPYE